MADEQKTLYVVLGVYEHRTESVSWIEGISIHEAKANALAERLNRLEKKEPNTWCEVEPHILDDPKKFLEASGKEGGSI